MCYSGVESEKEFIKHYTDVVHGLLESPTILGFCSSHLTVVETVFSFWSSHNISKISAGTKFFLNESFKDIF